MLNLTENQKLWIAALRSGEFEQTTGTLQDPYGFCCLGVACKIAPQEMVNFDDGILIGDDLGGQFNVQEWLGLNDTDGSNSDPEIGSLIKLNDEDCLDFEEIADILETVPGYFIDPTV